MKSIDIDYIRFGFENCETLVMPANDIAAFSIDDVQENYTLYYNRNKNEAHNYKSAKYVCIKIKKEANKEYYPFDVSDLKTTVFNRLEQCDITSIEFLNKKQETIEEFYVSYDGQESNSNQTTRIDDYNFFEVRIAGREYDYAD